MVSVSVKEAAKFLGVSRSCVYDKVNRGALKAEENTHPCKVLVSALVAYRDWRGKEQTGRPPETGEMTLKQAATYFGLTYPQMRQLCVIGEVEAEKRRGRWYVLGRGKKHG